MNVEKGPVVMASHPEGFVDPLSQEPDDLQICECWDEDTDRRVFAQWLGGPKRFFDVDVNYLPELSHWKPQ